MKIVVGGIVEKDGKVLLVQEAKEKCYGKWNISAGGLEHNESITEGAIREVKEETLIIKEKKVFDKYAKKILELNKFEKNDILNEKFELYTKSNLKIYYAPHNEIINEKAKIFIVGITPGWTQTTIAYKTAHDGLINNLTQKQIKQECKRNSRFAGSMRKNLVEMLDELKLNDKLNLGSCSELFENKDYLLHTTSVIPYPVFINNKNYTGTNPKIMENEVLYSYAKKYFYKEIKSLPNALIIPLGKSVEEVLNKIIKEELIKEEQCLLGFPHPSGANGHRKNQFKENKEKLSNIIEEYFKNS